MRKYSVVTSVGRLPYHVSAPNGLIIAVFRDIARANRCVALMNLIGNKF